MKEIEYYFLIFVIFIFSCRKERIENNIIKVPDEIPSIQEAINRAHDFDTILVSRGNYIESLTFYGKHIYLTSFFYRTKDTMDIVNTILTGHGGSVVRFNHSEDTMSVVDGFTLTGGGGEHEPGDYGGRGGGIYIRLSNPTLRNLIIQNNYVYYPHTSGTGGGIYCDSGSVRGINLKIRKNTCGTQSGGGGIYAINSVVQLDKCEITHNLAGFDNSKAGLYFSNVHFLIKNSKIANNPGAQYPIEVVIDQSVGSMINTICNSMSFAYSTIEFHNCIINWKNYP
jgi:hypothetical protein